MRAFSKSRFGGMVHGMEYHHTTPYHSETYVSQNFRTHMYIHMVQKRSHLDAIQPSANRTHVIQTMTPADGGSTNPEDPPVPSNEEKVVMESQQTASGRSAFNFKDWFEAAARKTLVRVETASTRYQQYLVQHHVMPGRDHSVGSPFCFPVDCQPRKYRLAVEEDARKYSMRSLQFVVACSAISTKMLNPNYPLMVSPGGHPDSFPDTEPFEFNSATYFLPMMSLLGVAISSIFLGQLSDKVGRKKPLLVMAIISGIGNKKS